MKIDPGSAATPLLRRVSLVDAAAFSPWPARLMGLEPWQKPERDEKEVLREYNEGWYRELLGLWDAFERDLDAAEPRRVSPLRFYYRLVRHIATGIEKNKAVYRSSQDNYLFSFGDEFVVGDLTVGTLLQYDMIVRYVDEQLARTPLRTVVEPGCGSGVVLFHLYEYLDLDRIVGGDICPNAVALANRIAGRCGVPCQFREFDYRRTESLRDLTRGLEDYLLLTCHSLEQTQVARTGFLDSLLALPNPPALVMHFEPVCWDDPSLMGQLCRRYAEQNRYNRDLLDALLRYQGEGRIEVLDCKKRCFGASAFNPTSFLCWKPRR
jgi:SAM-dependent methyltransferase